MYICGVVTSKKGHGFQKKGHVFSKRDTDIAKKGHGIAKNRHAFWDILFASKTTDFGNGHDF